MERVMSKVQSIQVFTAADKPAPNPTMLRVVDEQGRRLNLWVGHSEGYQIACQLAGEVADRPMTYRLVATVLDAFSLKITRADVTELKDDTFFGRLTVEGGGQVKTFDARPSDAINLALAASAEIAVTDEVFNVPGSAEEPTMTLSPMKIEIHRPNEG
jgi:bifunctional DNase/RNase